MNFLKNRWIGIKSGTKLIEIQNSMPPLRNTGAACRPDAARKRMGYARWRAWFLRKLLVVRF
jgi:hypothetical protein